MSTTISPPPAPGLGLFLTPAFSLPPRMIGGVLMGLLFGKIGYYLVLGWCCVSIFVFMVSWGSREHEVEDTGLLGRVGFPWRHPSRGCQVGSLDQSCIAELRSPEVVTTAWGSGRLPGRGGVQAGAYRKRGASQTAEVGGCLPSHCSSYMVDFPARISFRINSFDTLEAACRGLLVGAG